MRNYNDVSNCVIKVNNDFLKVDWDSAGEQTNLKNFRNIITNSFTCLNTPVKSSLLNVNKQNIEDTEESQEIVDDLNPKYLKLTFEDATNAYSMLIDIEGLVYKPNGVEITKGDYSAYILYVKFSVISKSPVQ